MRLPMVTLVLLASAIGASFAQPQDGDRSRVKPDDLPEEGSISVAKFGKQNVIGHLGHPLGTIVRVTGKAVDGDATRSKGDAGKTLLEIQTVNGESLKHTIVFDFHRAAESVSKPKPGENFDYYVHEYGSFDGEVVPPEELGIEYEPIAQDGFYYRPQITIHKSLR